MALLCLAASTFAAAPELHAQAAGTLTTIGYFNGANGIAPNRALIVGPDGNLYGVTPASGGPNTQGTFFRVYPEGRYPNGGFTVGAIQLIYSFGDSAENISPSGPLLLARDGSFYGTAGDTVYRITTDGVFGIVHTLAGDGSEGTGLVAGLVQGNDGALYGLTQAGGIITPLNPAGDGTIFRLTTNGDFTTIYQFSFNRTSVDGSGPDAPLVLGSDGSFYGVTSRGGTDGVGSVYRVTTGGTFTTIYNFTGQEGNNPVGGLVEGERGIFYGINSDGGAQLSGTFFSVTTNGVVNVLHSFTADELSLTGQTNPQSGLVKASDGSFYLTVQTSGSTPDHVLQLTPTGIVITALQFNADAAGTGLAGALVQVSDGSFYGTTVEGGVVGYDTPAEGAGTVFRLTFRARPEFFDAQVDLSNQVEYLSFANGKYFGYYSFLADPRYIYHFDLGYEYVIDANDGRAGVYLYDFRSQHFFYTSPTYPFPYLYDFTLGATLYYYPDPNNPGRYNINGMRYFYNFGTRRVFTQ